MAANGRASAHLNASHIWQVIRKIRHPLRRFDWPVSKRKTLRSARTSQQHPNSGDTQNQTHSWTRICESIIMRKELSLLTALIAVTLAPGCTLTAGKTSVDRSNALSKQAVQGDTARGALARQLLARGQSEQAQEVIAGRNLGKFKWVSAGELGFWLENGETGIVLTSAIDSKTGRELLAPQPTPRFEIVLRDSKTTKEEKLTSAAGWQKHVIRQERGHISLHWAVPAKSELGEITVTVGIKPHPENSSVAWTIKLENPQSA